MFPCHRKHFNQFYSQKTKIYKKFWKSEKLRAEKVEKSEIFMIFELQTVPNFRLGDENFWKNHVLMSQKAFVINSINIKQKFIKSF